VIYWDTSCVLKLYTAESDSVAWQAIALKSEDDFASSALLETELALAMEQKESRRELKPDGAHALLQLFRRDLKEGRFILYPVGSDVLKDAVELAAACYQARHPVPIRTLDGIHLATCRRLKCRLLATADHRMRAGSALLKMPVLQPS
jgi:predicted nucleic acid-binding protein